MTFKKIHRRADLDQFKRASIIALGQETTTAHTTTDAHGINPSGPPLVETTSSTTAASSSAVSSSSTASTSAASTTSTVSSTLPTTPPAASNTPVAHVTNTPSEVIRTATSHLTVTGTSSTVSPTSTSEASSGMGMGSMIGIGVAAVIGIGVITAFVIWSIRRRRKNHDIDEEPFNRNSFLRNSAAIPDDEGPIFPRTRPTAAPSMAERQPTPLYGQPTQTFGAEPGGFNYTPQPSYGISPGQTFNPGAFGPGGAPATPLPHSPGFGTAYDQQGFNNGGYQELTRGPGIHDYPPSPASRGFEPQMENPHSPGYNGHESFPMPPPGVPGGASFDEHGHEIRSMTSAQQGHVVSVSNSLHDGREIPVQLGFAPAPAHSHPPAHGRAPGARPDTIYDDDDAYGGI